MKRRTGSAADAEPALYSVEYADEMIIEVNGIIRPPSRAGRGIFTDIGKPCFRKKEKRCSASLCTIIKTTQFFVELCRFLV